jgi:hypothetical protein
MLQLGGPEGLTRLFHGLIKRQDIRYVCMLVSNGEMFLL